MSQFPVFFDSVEFSDDEDFSKPEEPHSWEDRVLKFGKFKGSNLGAMLKTRRMRNYLKYLISWDDLDDDIREDINTALTIYEDAKKAAQANTQPAQS